MQTTFVIQQVIVLAILMSVGYIATRRKIITEEISNGMTLILTNIGLPALILSSFDMSYSKETLKGVILILLYSVIIHIFIILISKVIFIKYSKEKKAVLAFGTIFANTGFMGLPLIFELFGQEAALYASVFMIPYHALQWTYGENMFSKEKSQGVIKKIAASPALIAVILGVVIFIFKIQMPYVVGKPLSILSSLTSPLSMLILGQKITKLKLKDLLLDKDVYYGCFVKLIIIPNLTLVLLKSLKAPELLLNISVIMQSLPTAILLVVLSQKHDGDIEFASKFTLVSHILSIITIPIISLLL